tara:strand:- start:280 stop:819 length:540 start_codon:yes stop_codon:yes gene_type:complete
MELILTQDVPNVGIANEVVRVKDGFARNYLLPKKLAVIATSASVNERAAKIQKAKERKAIRLAEASELAERMSRLKVTFERKASEEGRLFGSVTKEDIVSALAELHHITIDRKQMHLPTAIKTLGETQVKIRLETGISGVLAVEITPEGGALPQPEPSVEAVDSDKDQSEATVSEETAE